MIALPLCKRRCDLAQQGLHQWRQIGLLLGRQVDAWCVLLEKARLEIFGSARHYQLPPLLIRIGGSLKAHRPRCAGISREKRGLSLISKCDAASCVIQTGRQASELSGCRITTNWTPLRSSRRVMTTVSL